MSYLATGDNRGYPDLDRLFANYVGASTPQARAIADQWITNCDQQLDRQAAAYSSSAAAAAARSSYEAATASSEAAASASEAAVEAEQQRSCAAIGGKAHDSVCQSASRGHVTGDPYTPCSAATVWFRDDGTIDQADLGDAKTSYPGCFG